MKEKEKPQTSPNDFLWTIGFVFSCVVLMYRLMTSLNVVDTQSVVGGTVIGLVGALAGIILKRVTVSLPVAQRIAIIVALIVVAFFIR